MHADSLHVGTTLESLFRKDPNWSDFCELLVSSSWLEKKLKLDRPLAREQSFDCTKVHVLE